MNTKITPEKLIELGFIHRPNMIQDSWEYIFEDIIFEKTFPGDTVGYSYKSISLSICNDKGLGEYYVFLREGSTQLRHEDDVLTITRNMLYVEDLELLLKILKFYDT